MSAPAGPCEWCGGPQQWTIIRDEMYVRCVLGCLPLDLEDLVPPLPISEGDFWTPEGAGEGTILRMGGVPPEGSAAKTSDSRDNDGLPF